MASTQKQKTASGGSVAGLLNGCMPGSIISDGSWSVGKSALGPI